MRPRLLVTLVLALAFAAQAQSTLPSIAPITGTINAAGSTCTQLSMDSTNSGPSNCVSEPLPSAASSASIVLTGTFSATVQFELTADTGRTWVSAPVASAFTAGTTNFSFGGYNGIRARASSYVSGSISVTIAIGVGTTSAAAFSTLTTGTAPGAYVCLQSTPCTTPQQLTRISGNLAGGTSSPSNSLYATGSALWRNQSLLAANNLNNINNLCVHKENAVPTISNVTADPGTHYQPIESCVWFPNISGPSDMVEVDFFFLCTTCISQASTLQFRLADPSTSCTVTSASFTSGGNNQMWKGRAYVVTNGSVNGSVATIDLLVDFAGGGTTYSGAQKTSTCSINMGGGYAIGLDILAASTNAAIVDTWTPYMVLNTTSF
ncbi:MAG TPA: hypothetical protein VFF58_00660 [Candidatus Nitrosotalea sp.]|nr:hypothetical protein [Candidatus Nitrosotalea sp.]